MALRVVGAGVGRTGTSSLKVALELLVGAPCYHMAEVFEHPEHVPAWHAAARGEDVDWPAVLDGYAAAVDWPASAFWPELSSVWPDALVLLSTRASAEEWYRSVSNTILRPITDRPPPEQDELLIWREMVIEVLRARFTPHLDDPGAAMAAYERHNAAVRAGVPADRLLDWRPTDGWSPICAALGLPVPDEPFPLTNTTAEWQARAEPDP